MAYQSIDQLQNALAHSVFEHTIDRKKAAGGALGTLVEIITYYTLRSWGFRDSIAIERRLPEFANPAITHNVEFSLHPILTEKRATVALDLPLSAVKLSRALTTESAGTRGKSGGNVLLTWGKIVRNSCVIAESATGPMVAHVDAFDESKAQATIDFVSLYREPYAIVECKRVGVEQGMKKGPQTIEKAKQGAYVARSVSSLQKVRMRDGSFAGVIHRRDGTLDHKPYEALIEHVIGSDDPALLDGFILTVSVVSNHGNWFTSENHNKELRVLAQAYDWLLFLTDSGLSEFIDQVIFNPPAAWKPVGDAFRASYAREKAKNRFTKVQMDMAADAVLQEYFTAEKMRIRGWFNVINPVGTGVEKLHQQLDMLKGKDWQRIKGL